MKRVESAASAASEASEACPSCLCTIRCKPGLGGWEFPCPGCGAFLARIPADADLHSWMPPPRRPGDGPEPRVILWCGILGLLLGGLLGPVAWRLARNYLDGCRKIGVQPPGTVTAGWILGMVGTVELFAAACAVLAVLVPYLLLKG